MEAEIFEAGPPLEGKWVVAWRTPLMSVPAFAYFDSREEALRFAGKKGLVKTVGQALAPGRQNNQGKAAVY